LIQADLDHITQGVYNLVQTENDAVQAQVDNYLNVARHLLAGSGEVHLAKESIVWTATNQFSKQSKELRLPKLLVGEQWLGKNVNPAIETVVDQVTRLVGETATIFQRMNEQGDMLRVATTVRTSAGERAIGTYIPAIEPGGATNPVIATILNGGTYHGCAYVVNAWYLTAYVPINDNAGELVGMLYVGVKQEAAASRIRQAILQNTVGKTGYVYVLGGGREDRGRYIISARGERDGEDIWSHLDSDGRYVVREIIGKATALKPGEMTTVRYRWQNPGEPEPRWKLARLAYYAPWDWVIGTSVYEDELHVYSGLLSEGRARMVRIMGAAGFVITAFIGLLCMFITWSITRPVRQMTEVAEKITGGDLAQVVPVASSDEIGLLARNFNLMTAQLSRSMEGLKKSEEKYRGIFENALEGLYQSSLQGRFLNANPALAHILGYESPEELIASITDIRHQFYVNPSDRDTLLAAISNHRKAFGFEVQCYRKDGRKIWIAISARLRYDEKENPDVIEGFITDINNRKQAEEALAESRNYLDEIINSVGDPVFVKDSRHLWVLVNNAMCAFMGRSRPELLGKSDYDFFPVAEADVFQAKDAYVLASGLESINEESFTDAKGVSHTIVTRKTRYTDKKGEQFIVGIVRDITGQKRDEEERRRLEARLNQAQKMEAIGALAGGIAHDFNNILQPMLGYAEMLCLHLPAESTQQRYVKRIHTAGLRAKELVDQILAFSRQSEHKKTPVLIQAILKEVCQLCRSTIPSTIEISMDMQGGDAFVLLNPSQLHQVAMNLIVNAYHAVEQSGGKIAIGLKKTVLTRDDVADGSLSPGRYAHFSVSDTGCGIDPALLSKVFEPYFTTKEQGKGTGLGLAVVYGIVKEHHGDIRIISEVGQGTTINVYLPLFEDAAATAAIAPAVSEACPTGSEHILLVDDDVMIVELETLMLESLGYRVTARLNSVEALELFRADPAAYDLVVTDLTMPHLTGAELAGAIFAIRPGTPLIICSGLSESIGREMAKSIGVREVLMKPLTITELSQKVRMVLDASLLHDREPATS
jgi:PAS domain S-box-containing protein